MSALREMKCVACEGGIPALGEDEVKKHLQELNGDWRFLPESSEISRVFTFANYYQTMAFVNATAWVSHQENHHPDLQVHYHKCEVRYSTHAVNGLTTNDFICAAKIDAIL